MLVVFIHVDFVVVVGVDVGVVTALRRCCQISHIIKARNYNKW